jgi:hypothetical protein
LIRKLDHFKAEIGEDLTASSVEHFTVLVRNWFLDHVIQEVLLLKPALQKLSLQFVPR